MERLPVGAHAEQGLFEILQLAHSGELAAALAYNGHWRSVRDAGEREHIRIVEQGG
jgi:demethoxyubiquinone hydroxylase (CLK1/Coq7/Cat5 family)